MSKNNERSVSECIWVLYKKEYLVGWWWPTHRFHTLHAVGAQWIEAHTVFPGNQVFR